MNHTRRTFMGMLAAAVAALALPASKLLGKAKPESIKVNDERWMIFPPLTCEDIRIVSVESGTSCNVKITYAFTSV